MGYSYDESDQCHFCGVDTDIFCDECRRYVCSKIHSKRILIDSKHYVDICIECQRKLRRSPKVGGVRINRASLDEDWHEIKDFKT